MKTTAPDARPDSLKTDSRQVEDAGKKDLKAQGELYVKYRDPLRVHLLGQFRSYPAVLRNWEDLLADFTQKKILSGSFLRMWKPGRGRFRDFLRTSLTNFVRDWLRKRPEFQDEKARQKKRWKEYNYFAAIDWTNDRLDILIVDRAGTTVAEFRFPSSKESWREFDRKMQPFGQCPITIGPGVSAPNQLLKRDYPLYQPDIQVAERYYEERDSGSVTNLRALGNAFRAEGCEWWQLRSTQDPGIAGPPPPPPPQEEPDLDLARVILAQTLDKLERDCKNPMRTQPRYTQIWEVFRLRILEPILNGATPPPYEELIKILDIPPESDPAFMLWTARQMFSERLTDIVNEYEEAGIATKSELMVMARFLE